MEAAPQKREVNDLLKFRGYITEGVLVLAGNRDDCVLLSPDDAIPEYHLIPDLLEELGAQPIKGNEKENLHGTACSVWHDEPQKCTSLYRQSRGTRHMGHLTYLEECNCAAGCL
jgi:hypothetical protein